MQIEITNPNGIITSAFFECSNNKCFSVIINTKNKYITSDCAITSYISNTLLYKGFSFTNENSLEEDIVKLIPDSLEDQNILKRLVFLLHEKDQLWYVFLDASLYL